MVGRTRSSGWLRRWRDPLAVAALLLVGLHPFSYTSLATSFDGLLHLYRLVELDHLLRQGEVYPRWAPDFVFGFGYPIFNFYAPLAYYISALVHALGVTYVDTATIFFIACTLAGAWSMHALARELSCSRHAALVAALAYGYAPTHIYDNFYRSAWGTVLAFALAPFVFWALLRWHRGGAPRHAVSAALGVAALMLSHNVSALLFMPLAGVAALAYALDSSATGRARMMRIGVALGALGIGVGLSAFFWLPSLSETAYVQTWRLVIPPDFDFRTHFMRPADWLAWPAPAEVGRINPDLVNTLGPVQCALAALGLGAFAAGLRGAGRARTLGAWGFVALALMGSLFMTLPESRGIWERVALLPSLQFPHRFLTVAAFCAPLLGALAVAAVPLRWRGAATAVIAVALVLSALPFMYPRPQPQTNPEPGLAEMLAHEHRTGALGTTASGEYLPVWVKFVPRSSAFEEAIANGENPLRLESRSMPPGSKVIAHTTTAFASTITLSATQPFTATIRQFYFPGWQAYVDGQAVATLPSEGQGLTQFVVPSGTHTVQLRFESTPVRDIGTAISLATLALLVCGLIGLTIARTRRVAASAPATEQGLTGTIDELPGAAFFALLGIGLLVLKVGIVDVYNTPFRTVFDGLHIHTLQYLKPSQLGGGITWLGYSIASEQAESGSAFDLTLYWKAEREIPTVYSSFAQVIDERSNLYAQKDNLHPGGAPTTTWREGEFNVDRHLIEIPAGTPPGDYWLSVGLYDPNNGARVLRADAAAGEPPDQLRIGPVRITRAAGVAPLDALQIQHPLERASASGLRLLGYSLDKERVPAGDFLRVAVFWQAEHAPLPDARMTLRLIDAQGREGSAQSSAPSNDRYPAPQWSAGERVRDNRALWCPPELPPGAYRLQLRIDGESEWIDLATLSRP